MTKSFHLALCILYHVYLAASERPIFEHTYTAKLTGSGKKNESPYTLQWSVSPDRRRLAFKVCLNFDPVKQTRLFGVGFGSSDLPAYVDVNLIKFPPSDYRSKRLANPLYAEGYTDGEHVFHLRGREYVDDQAGDQPKSVSVYVQTESDGEVCFSFERDAVSCNEHGYTIDDQTTRIFIFNTFYSDRYEINDYDWEMKPKSQVWSKFMGDEWTERVTKFRGQMEEGRSRGLNISKTNFQLIYEQLIKSSTYDELPSYKDAESFEVRVHRVSVPQADTTYWCKTVLLPRLPKKRHIIRFEPILESEMGLLVHHMEVFACTGSKHVRHYEGLCNSETKPDGLIQCRRVIAAWAVGATGLTFPKEAGIPIGGVDGHEYAVIEIHYDNPRGAADHIDSSGFRIYVTANLRPHDAGVIELGTLYSDRSAIPPEAHNFVISGYCDSQCTDVALPEEGITVFASQLHTHSVGQKVVTYHMRGAKRLSDLNRDDHFCHRWQEIRLLKEPIQVRRGDSLITKCTYDTSNKNRVVFHGLGSSEEMCLSYIFYYPKSDLELCKSEVAQPELDTYLTQALGANAEKYRPATLQERFNAIDWGVGQVASLQKMYDHSTFEMHCNGSNGIRIPNSEVHIRPKPVPSRVDLSSMNEKLDCLIRKSEKNDQRSAYSEVKLHDVEPQSL
ncbi:unnamed protein product [Calicophoron daubneyi]|uniref:Tyramine beta hydroxylase n=1 Tax=Calicophoron daubneyi TaxID=300641 RepID=A0AAV2TVC1_CALDB